MIGAIPSVSIIHKKTRTEFSILLCHSPVSPFSSIFYRQERQKVATRLFLWQLQVPHWFSAQCLWLTLGSAWRIRTGQTSKYQSMGNATCCNWKIQCFCNSMRTSLLVQSSGKENCEQYVACTYFYGTCLNMVKKCERELQNSNSVTQQCSTQG